LSLGWRGGLAPAPFVVGVGRSGTTLLRLMLDAHPELTIPPETHFVADLIALCGPDGAPAGEVGDLLVEHRQWGDFGLDSAALRERLAEGGATVSGASALRAFYGLYAEDQGKPRWGDKTPGHLTEMRSIAGTLPEARFVHLIRDGRDVLASRRRLLAAAGRPQVDAAQVAAGWRRRIDRGRRQGRRLDHYLEIRFEDLVAEPRATLIRVCELIDLAFDDAMLHHHERASRRLGEMDRDIDAGDGMRARSAAERAGQHARAAEPPRPELAGAWRETLSDADRRAFEREAGALLTELGYPVESNNPARA
jgi:hypothetical protein